MRQLIYQTINKLGYNIYNKNSNAREIKKKLKKYNIQHHEELLFLCSKYLFIFEKNFEDFIVKESEKGLEISFLDLVFDIDSSEEFLILNEIFIDQEYNFVCNEDCILIDIGANVGIASIYFSQLDHVQKIYSFEPVKDTFEIAENNLKRNNIMKISQFSNFGLGNLERKEQFLFRNNAKGNCGIRGQLSPSYHGENDYEKRTVLIKQATEVLEPIFNENKNFKIVVKMDCEGSEYEILENLYNSYLLNRIHIIVLEWHDFGAEILENYLKDNNFTVFSRRLSSISGMIYAVRNDY
jgi:FkbM family methyltransferase